MRRLWFCFLVSLILPATICRGQYYFKHYQADDGLAHNAVACVFQDSRGLLWVGTRGGLNRFDGYTFKTFTNKGNKFGYLGNNIIKVIAEDSNGMLLIGTGKGIIKYDPYREVFTPLDLVPRDIINNLAVDKENNLWFLSGTKFYKYSQHDHKLENFHLSASCMAIGPDGDIWIGKEDGTISIYTPRNKSFKNVDIADQNAPANSRSVSKIYPITSNEVLIGCFKQGLKSYSRATGLVKPLLTPNDKQNSIYVRDITAGSNSQYWIATESGIYIYDLAKNSYTHLQKRAGDPYSIADNAVYTLCKDNQGGMWAGTFFGGLNYYSKDDARFEKYYPQPGINAISGNAVREICTDGKGNLWIGTEDAGINKLNLKTGLFTTYTATGKKGDISYPNIHGLLPVGNQLFIGPFLGGMEIMDMRTGKITDHFKYVGDKNDNKSDFIHDIHLTKDNQLFIGTAIHASGLFTYNIRQKTFKRIKQIPYNSGVYKIYEDPHGNLWTSSDASGAFFYNPKTGQSGNIRFGDTVKNKIINEFAVRDILEDSNHAMWFATDGGGLIKLDASHRSIKKFSIKTGLPSNVLFSILEDNEKRLWISSLKGLICFDLSTEKFKTYTQSNGLITDQFNYNSAYKSGDGKMYFGSVKGMIAFYPTAFDKKNTPPPTYITGFQINNKEIVPDAKDGPLQKSILFSDSIVLTHEQNNFSIEFAALNYSSPRATKYKYLMKGLDKNWTYLSVNRNAYFTGLGPGDYTFIVKAESNTGSWDGKERMLFIKILPPFWKSYLAYCVYILILGIALYLSIRYYHRYNERKNSNKLQLFEHEKKKEIYEAKIEFFTNIAHEIQTPLTLIVGPLERLIKKTEELPGIKKSLTMVEKNAKRLAELTGQLLDFRKTEMNQFGLNFVNVDISILLKEQITAFKQEAEKNNVKLQLQTGSNHLIGFVDREALVKICSNLVSNAIKYAATIATITAMPFNETDQFFTIRFINDGKPIPDEFRERIFEPFFRLRGNDKPGTGIGLSLAQSLTQLHNGTLKLVSGDANLIIFELSLPVHQQFEFKLGNWKKIK